MNESPCTDMTGAMKSLCIQYLAKCQTINLNRKIAQTLTHLCSKLILFIIVAGTFCKCCEKAHIICSIYLCGGNLLSQSTLQLP